MSLRAKGFTGAVYRMMEAIRSLPARLPTMLPWTGGEGTSRRAAALLTNQELFHEDLHLVAEPLLAAHRDLESGLALAFARAGFDLPENLQGVEDFKEELDQRIVSVIRGPARDRIVRAAGWLTSWPVTVLLDATPLAFVGYTGYRIVWAYFQMPLLDSSFFFHAATVLAILMGIELLVLSMFARMAAWGARKTSLHDLSAALNAPGLAFQQETALLANVQRLARRVAHLKEAIR